MGKKGIKKKKRKQERMKTITILLTGYSDWFGRFIRVISRSGYSHASLSIDGTEEVFYSLMVKALLLKNRKNANPGEERKAVSVYAYGCLKVSVMI